jgi:V8-like Glu-specific endopeptidase
MEVYVGRRDRSSYLADEVVTSRSRLKVSRAWRTSRNSLLDWGVIVLRNRYGADFGRFTLKPWPASVLKSTKFNVVGYPQSSDTRTGIAYQMWAHVGRIIWVGMRTVRYRMDTSPGQSGAPIIAWEGSASSVVGVHNYGNPNFNQATRVTPEIKSAIQKVIASV